MTDKGKIDAQLPDARPPTPCTLNAANMERDSACRACGHYSGLHRGLPRPNPELSECLACTVAVLRWELTSVTAWVGRLAS